MENKITPELIAKAKQAKSAEELLTFAKENGIEISEDEAKDHFEQLNKSGELSDEELDNVSGGGCHYKDGRMIVTVGCEKCADWACKVCGRQHTLWSPNVPGCTLKTIQQFHCDGCRDMQYEHGLWLCNSPYNMKK